MAWLAVAQARVVLRGYSDEGLDSIQEQKLKGDYSLDNIDTAHQFGGHSQQYREQNDNHGHFEYEVRIQLL